MTHFPKSCFDVGLKIITESINDKIFFCEQFERFQM